MSMLVIHSMPKVGLKDSQKLFRNLPVRSSLEIPQEWSHHSKSFARNPFLIQYFNSFIKFQFSDRTWRNLQIFQNIFDLQVVLRCKNDRFYLTLRFDRKISFKILNLRCLELILSIYCCDMKYFVKL